jgi:hypothetical protein
MLRTLQRDDPLFFVFLVLFIVSLFFGRRGPAV